ncbi:succinylglutamate desuccinylase [Vibrio diazotrophicus]|uniref:succinylglutamate desuccinylase n=1 Tax=Vibrio diazotrophicus TaxID=685 RepID=UPI0022AE6EDF|nr:succinylglutamate desuccinylase [Vibrio diazotrophicus]MCZ4373476.1 succinylglutamate desuccinylase [Vibrio diazotrophicus]
MTKSLFRQSFLFDSLDLEQSVKCTAVTTPAGVTLKLLQRGILEVVPAKHDDDTKNIVISCGIHGDETAPMELIDKLVNDILSGFQTVNERCLFIIANPEATKLHKRSLDEDLNHLFDEKAHEESKELAIADNLKLVIKDFYAESDVKSRWHLDLHCAFRDSKHYSFAVSPKSRHPVRSKELLDFVENGHIDAVMFSNAPASTFSWYSAEIYAAQAMMIELGRVAEIGSNDLQCLTAFDLSLRDLVSRSQSEHLPRKATMYRVSRTIVRIHDDFDFLFDDNISNFTSFMHGEVFGHDGDKPLMAKNEEEAIVFPNRHAAVGERAALMVCKVKIRYEDGQAVYD